MHCHASGGGTGEGRSLPGMLLPAFSLIENTTGGDLVGRRPFAVYELAYLFKRHTCNSRAGSPLAEFSLFSPAVLQMRRQPSFFPFLSFCISRISSLSPGTDFAN